MTRQTQIRPEFVTFAPDVLLPGVLYVSMEYATVLHTCCCGCGNKVVTPLAPGRWRVMYDGKVISLAPSIGNWSFTCQSHYWIERNAVVWDRPFTSAEITAVRAADRRAMQAATRPEWLEAPDRDPEARNPEPGAWWRRVLQRFRR